MPTYFYWGEDEYQLTQAIKKLRSSVLDPLWADFNYVKIIAGTDQQIIEGLNQAVTLPFGQGNRLTWLAESTIAQRCSDLILDELARTLANLPAESYLLFTSSSKPDNRIKSTKLLQKYATFLEFSLIPSWNSEAITELVKKSAHSIGLNLKAESVNLLADAIGNDSRRLSMELKKIQLCYPDTKDPLDVSAIKGLITANSHNSLQLASAIRTGNTSQALTLLAELLSRNEPGLKICATLTGQFRTWLWIKLMQEGGVRNDTEIAAMAEVGNPKRIYFLKQEVQALSSAKLLQTLPILLDLEVSLKSGIDEVAALQTTIIQLCQVLKR